MQNKTRIKRLKQLSHMLKNHHKIFKTVHFNMALWVASKKEFENEFSESVPSRCGTVACALGSAGLYRTFREAGLKTNNKQGEVWYREHEGFYAAQEFFGISYVQSLKLFSGLHYTAISPRILTVAKRVDNLIKQYQA